MTSNFDFWIASESSEGQVLKSSEKGMKVMIFRTFQNFSITTVCSVFLTRSYVMWNETSLALCPAWRVGHSRHITSVGIPKRRQHFSHRIEFECIINNYTNYSVLK